MSGGSSLVQNLQQVSESCICLHTRMAARAITRAYDAVLAPLGLEATQFTLLAAIAANPARSVTAMADTLALERTSLSRNLSLLKRRGLISVAASQGRSVHYTVTIDGETLLAQALPLWRKVQTDFEGQIGEDGWSETRSKLRKLRHSAPPPSAKPAP
jgi:DNA-binding MarR family transcriptional regulator